MSPKSHSNRVGAVVIIAISCVLTALSLFLIFNRQYVIDQIAVWQYHPTSAITTLINRTGMNDDGKFLYLASKPKVDATQSFNNECDRVEKITSILGCYSDYHIFIYDVTDPQLDGIKEVTAAHETLHAAYMRMGSDEKAKVDKLLEIEYKKMANNKDLTEMMAFYARTEPGQRDNELHSVIGTEISNISPELETHYKKYFTDRQKVVGLYNKYISVFQKLSSRASDLSDQLKALAVTITAKSTQYNTDAQTLNNDITAFNKRATDGDFSSLSQFYAERNRLSSRVADLDATRTAINADVAKYNTTLDEYNSIASESKKLYNSIDSTLAPAPSV
ncbi:MAG: hypothetical protein WCJ36_01820 [Candidatus Saccharibacteria bacterium]